MDADGNPLLFVPLWQKAFSFCLAESAQPRFLPPFRGDAQTTTTPPSAFAAGGVSLPAAHMRSELFEM